MDSHEDAILQLVRLALKGDVVSIERFANRILRRSGNDAFRHALSQLLVVHAGRAVAPRRQTRTTTSSSSTDADLVLQAPKLEATPILTAAVSEAIERLLRERASIDALDAAGLEPTRSALLVGPPGVGKTMTASYVAARLGLPLIALDLVTVMSSMLGQSGQNIRRAIDHARSTPCVFLLDEVDAIAKRRDDAADVGELKRIVNMLLLELDRWPSTSLLIAATNHPELLDRALWRRFDVVIDIPLPDEEMRRRIIDDCLVRHGRAVDPMAVSMVARLTRNASGSDLAQSVRAAVRESVLGDVPLDEALRRNAILGFARSGARGDEASRALFCQLAHDELKLTHREIGALLGVSHVTVGKVLKKGSKGTAKRRGRSATSTSGEG